MEAPLWKIESSKDHVPGWEINQADERQQVVRDLQMHAVAAKSNG